MLESANDDGTGLRIQIDDLASDKINVTTVDGFVTPFYLKELLQTSTRVVDVHFGSVAANSTRSFRYSLVPLPLPEKKAVATGCGCGTSDPGGLAAAVLSLALVRRRRRTS